VRSVAINPATCDFIPGSDVLEVALPFLSATASWSSDHYSHPVGDIEFSADGMTMLLAETGYNSSIPATAPHQSRVLQYDGSTTNWTADYSNPSGNQHLKYEIGVPGNGTNSRGGVAFGYGGLDANGCTQADETFIVATGDALSGIACSVTGCFYGLTYMDEAGGTVNTSILHDVADDPTGQQKSVYGDVDIVLGCCGPLCPEPCSGITVTKN